MAILIRRALLALSLLPAACGAPPDSQGPEWYRGNLHTHSLWSDGDDFPEMVVAWYADAGYDFVALSDHNVLARGERWIRVDERRQPALDRYLDRFGPDWVETRRRGDTLEVRLRTFDEYRVRFDRPDTFLVVQAEEISDGFEGRPLHVNATNVRELIPPQGGASVTDVLQRNIDAVLAQRDSTGVAMVPHVNHPNFGWAVSPDDLVPLEGEHFFEVYNGHPAVHNEGDDLRPGTEPMWDYVNTARLAAGRPLLYGLAVDDAHAYLEHRVGLANPGRGWVMVRADALAPGAIVAALEAGAFYASSGVELEDVRFEAGALRLLIRAEEGVAFTTTFVGSRRAGGDSVVVGVVFDRQTGTEPSYRLSGDELFVRASVVSDRPMRNPYVEGEPERAWTQPVMPEGN
jgi:hypothetical protein